jgi:hypothetical protein
MATDASDAPASLPASPAPPAGEPCACVRSDDRGPSSVDSMDHDDEHQGGLSEEAAKKRHKAIACDAPPSAAQVARARAAALPPDACTDAHVTFAPTHNLPPTALWGRLLRLLLLHRTSTPRRLRSSLRRRSGRCLPAAARKRTRTLDRPSTRLRRVVLGDMGSPPHRAASAQCCRRGRRTRSIDLLLSRGRSDDHAIRCRGGHRCDSCGRSGRYGLAAAPCRREASAQCCRRGRRTRSTDLLVSRGHSDDHAIRCPQLSTYTETFDRRLAA